MKELSASWGVDVLEFGGEADHVHLLLEMNPSIQPSKYINNLKTVSSRHMKKEYGDHLKRFYWGTNAMWSRAYCLITTGGAPLSVLSEYIENQKGVVPLERRFGQENQEAEPQEGRKRRPFYGVIESPNK